jgi:hypothetical protein
VLRVSRFFIGSYACMLLSHEREEQERVLHVVHADSFRQQRAKLLLLLLSLVRQAKYLASRMREKAKQSILFFFFIWSHMFT